MAEELSIIHGDKKERYQTLLPQIEALIFGETDWVANLANVSAAIWQTFGFLWVGFYRVEGEELLLGPFQGPIACTRIPRGVGVCGTAWAENCTLIVPNVDEFPGHIACSSESKSEIVVPVCNHDGEVIFILDIDSKELNSFDETDKLYLTKITSLLSYNC